nr:hypothetical protein [Gordonia humi]
MPRTSRTATVLAAVAVTGALVTPAAAHAEPAAPAPSSQQTIPLPETAQHVDPEVLESIGTFAPALIGSVATRDQDGEVNTDLLDQARKLADNPAVPAQAAETWKSLIDFLGEPGKERAVALGAIPSPDGVAKKDVAEKGAPNIPTGPNKPRIQEFLYPTLGFGCMPDGGNSLGRALATAGPQAAPAPGPKRGQAGFVYTSLGTGPAKSSVRKLWVSWLNLENGRTGQTALKPNPKINAVDGPGTFTGIATTGRGRIVSTIYGEVTTKSKGRTISCTIAPTIGTAIV